MKTGLYNIPVPDNTDLVRVGAVVIPMIGFDNWAFAWDMAAVISIVPWLQSIPVRWLSVWRSKFYGCKMSTLSLMISQWTLS